MGAVPRIGPGDVVSITGGMDTVLILSDR